MSTTEPSRNTKPDARPPPTGTPPPRPPRTSPSNHVFIGKKPVMSYAMSALIQLSQTSDIVLKARGMVISRAVDVAEIVTKRLGNNAFAVKEIKIGTEVVGEGDESRNVSTIEISIGPKQ
ncbi:MAG: DNA-binding protein Alba [Thaumarchaeota archaeon]|nr:DNA-binding protein Alba [Nitrososphaerota archaeon]